MPRSMTGFGVATGAVGGGRLQCEIRTVNHKHLNVQLRVPSALQALEEQVRETLRGRMNRGHVAIQMRWVEEPVRPATVRLDLARARAVADALRQLREALGLSGELDLQSVARFPDVLSSQPDDDALAMPVEPVVALVNEALDGVLTMREREGGALAGELSAHLATIAEALAEVKLLAPERLTRERNRLRTAVAELLDGRTVNEDRLAQELAYLSEKLDVREEVVRLETHLDAARRALGRADPVGREMGFLGQEMLREINTIGSKASDAGIAQLVIDMKGELERFREQLENVE